VLSLSACSMVGTELDATQLSHSSTNRGLVVVGVDAPMVIDFLEFCSDEGCISTGPFTSRWKVRVLSLDYGRYCVSRISTFWRKGRNEILCFDVRRNSVVYPGHLVIRPMSTLEPDTPQFSVVHEPHPDINGILDEQFPGLQVAVARKHEPDYEPEYEGPTEDEHDLPERMGVMQIKQGIDRLKPGIEACLIAAGLASGSKFSIVFTIAGPTGAVIGAEFSAAERPELAQCVQEAIAAVQADGAGAFSRFTVEQQRFTFNFLVP
jgi:hypothetical protein